MESTPCNRDARGALGLCKAQYVFILTQEYSHMHLVTRWFGVFLVESETIVDSILFPKDPHEIADRIRIIREGGMLEEEKNIVEGKDVLVCEARHASLGKICPATIRIDNEAYGFDRNLLQKAMLILAGEGLAAPGRDRLLMQSVGAMEELNGIINLLSERLGEWYGHHGHGLVRTVSSKKLAELVSAYGSIDEIRQNTDLSPDETGKIDIADMAPIRAHARLLLEAVREKESLETYIQRTMADIAPNTSAVAGPVLGARLIAMAGGLEKLANMPASTVQVLGAEKALFLHLKDGTPPPKHGIIFQHTLVHNAPQWQRGKISRTLAGKISLAARVDSASGRDVSAELLDKLEKRVAEIRSRYPSPPPKKSPPGKAGKKGRKGGGRRR